MSALNRGNPPSPMAPDRPDRRGGVAIHLKVRVAESALREFLEFLGEAVPFYEEPGGIEIRLLRDRDDPEAFIEVVEYADHETFRRDQERVDSDPRMRSYLARWRALLMDAPAVVIYEDISDRIPRSAEPRPGTDH